MVMKQFFTFLLLFIGCVANAQIVVSNTSFPKVGDTLRTALDNLPTGIDLGNPGANRIWDFRSLQAPANNELILRPISEAENRSDFQAANWFYNGQGGSENFFRKTNATVLQMGFTGNSPLGGFDLKIVAKNQPNIVERTAPMRYEDTFNNSANQLIPVSASFLPDSLFEGLPIKPDSLRLNTAITQNSTIDAWGVTHIPMGSFDVLRERRVVISNRKIEAKSNALPIWIDVTSLFPIPGFSGIDTSVVYYYWNDKSIEPVAIVTTRGAEEQINNVQFKSDPQMTSTYQQPSNRNYDIIAYPNPAIGSVRFDMNGLVDGMYRLRLFNLMGQEVWSKRYQVNGGKRTVRLELGSFERGIYLYSLSDDKGRTLVTKRLVVLMP
jgi:hypothetical protein